MASASQLKALVQSYVAGDDDRFLSVALQVGLRLVRLTIGIDAHSRSGASLPLGTGVASGPATPTLHSANGAGRYAPDAVG